MTKQYLCLFYYIVYHRTASTSHAQKQSWTVKKAVLFPLSWPIVTSGRIGEVMREGWSKQLFHCCAFSDQLFNNCRATRSALCSVSVVSAAVMAVFVCAFVLISAAIFHSGMYAVDSFKINKDLEVCISKTFINSS